MNRKTNIRTLHVLKPCTYQKLYNTHNTMLQYETDPLVSHSIRLRNLLPAILNDPDLTDLEKMERYGRIMRKHRTLMDQIEAKHTGKIKQRLRKQEEQRQADDIDTSATSADVSMEEDFSPLVNESPLSTRKATPEMERYGRIMRKHRTLMDQIEAKHTGKIKQRLRKQEEQRQADDIVTSATSADVSMEEDFSPLVNESPLSTRKSTPDTPNTVVSKITPHLPLPFNMGDFPEVPFLSVQQREESSGTTPRSIQRRPAMETKKEDSPFISYLTEKKRPRARMILQAVKDNPHIEVNPEDGQIYIHGNRIHGGSLVDLINEMLLTGNLPNQQKRKASEASKALVRVLARKSLLGSNTIINPALKREFQQERTGRHKLPAAGTKKTQSWIVSSNLDKGTKTKSGRTVKIPNRYGQN